MENKKFHERFNIEVNAEEARERFIHRTYNLIFCDYYDSQIPARKVRIYRYVASNLGVQYNGNKFYDYVGSDFIKCLLSIEAVYKMFQEIGWEDQVFLIIENLFALTEVNIGIEWHKGQFIKTGAKELDEKLINTSLQWIDKNNYESVSTPFEKSLRHLLESEKDASKLSDVVTDAYEALEALAKIVNDNDSDLSANREQFIKNVKASDKYKKILREYINYANKFRHAIKEGKKKPDISSSEAESFVYLTGLFIRLASFN